MATGDIPPEILIRLSNVEDAVQRFEFIHMVRMEATTAGLGTLYAQQQRMQQELTGFRAETAAELETIKNEQARQSELLAEHGDRLDALDSKVEAVDSKVGAMDSKVEAVDSKVGTLSAKLEEHGAMLTEVLRRLPPPGGE